MKYFEAHPRDTLVLRDGRPMMTGAGRSVTMTLPWPSSIAGLVRTRIGQDENGLFVEKDLDALRAVETAGPWLVCDGQLFFPAPRDLLWVKEADDGSDVHAVRISPRQPTEGVLYASADGGLLPVAPCQTVTGKPGSGPTFWSWGAYENWLFGEDKKAPSVDGPSVVGELPDEERTHVAIDSDRRTYQEGQLFSTRQRRYVVPDSSGNGYRDFAIGFAADDQSALSERQVRGGLVALGGERRVVDLRPSDVGLPSFNTYASAFDGASRLKLTLLTPAIFDQGSLPANGLIAGERIVASCVGRPQVVSGWDFAKRRPKATVRVVPAGSTLWLDVEPGAARDVAERLWFRSVSTEAQARRDGFGLAVPSPADPA